MYIYIYIYICVLVGFKAGAAAAALGRKPSGERSSCIAAHITRLLDASKIRPVSITRFSITRFSPGSGLLRNPFVHR